MVTRVQHTPGGIFDSEDLHGLAAAQPQTVPYEYHAARVTGGHYSITGTGEVSESQSAAVARYTVGQEGTAGLPVAATLQGYGPARSVELEPGNPASRTSVKVAERMGLIVFSSDQNRWIDASPREAQAETFKAIAAPPPAPPQVDPGAEVFSPKLDAMLAAEIEPIPQTAYDTAIASSIAIISNPTASGRSLTDVATALARDSGNGMEPAKALEMLENVIWVHEQAAAKALTKAGLAEDTQQAFYEDLKNQPEKYQAALGALVRRRDPSELVKLGQAFADRNPSGEIKALQLAGFEVSRDASGGYLTRPKNSGRTWVPAKDLLATLKG